ncbi:MAG: tetratricopeptide repeat protein, partial [Myxococcales bacterium]
VVRPPDDPTVKRAVAEVRTQLADVKALANAGRYKDGAKLIEQVVRAARATNYEAVVAEALLLSAEIQDFDSPKMAEATYEQAMWAAESSHHDEVVVEAADQLVTNLAKYQDRLRDAFRWAAFAEARLKRLGPGHDVLEAWRQNNLAIAYHADGRLPQALALFEKAVQTKVGVLGENNFDVAISLDNVAYVSDQLGRTDEALIQNSRALAILRATVGTEHPIFASTLSNRAGYMLLKRRYPYARRSRSVPAAGYCQAVNGSTTSGRSS